MSGEEDLRAAARKVIAFVENFYREHLPGCSAVEGDYPTGEECDCGLDELRAALGEERA